MPSGISKHVLAFQRPRAELEHLGRCRRDVVDHDIEMKLLRPRWVGPLWWLMIWCELKRDARRGVVLGHNDPVGAGVRDAKAEQLCIELRQRCRFCTIDHYVMQPSDHGITALS